MNTDIAKMINDKANITEQYDFQYQMDYDKTILKDQENNKERCQQIGKLLGKHFELKDDNYNDFINTLYERIQQLQQSDLFEIVQENQTSEKKENNNMQIEEQYDATNEEIKLATNLIPNALMITDINKSDDDTICTSLKKSWPILLCIGFCGAALGMCLVNAPLHIQSDLGGTAMMVTLYQASFNFAQIFGSPFCHWLSEKIGYKPVYTTVYAFYTITMGLGALATIEKMGSRGGALAFLYCMRIIQGFMGVSQPLGFSMLSATISPRLRSYASSMNNVAYFTGGLLGTVINAFIAPAAGWYPKNGDNADEITYIHCMYICCVLCGLAFIFSLFVKECNPETLLRRAARKNGIKYQKPKQAKCTWREAFKIVFTNKNLVLSFIGLILGLGNSVSNLNVATIVVKSGMHFYNTSDAQKFISEITLIGILFCAIFAITLFQRCQKLIGLMPVVAISCWLAALCSILRCSSYPLSKVQLAFSAIFNQFGQILIDAPFITIVSTYTNAYNKARVMGVYQLIFLAGVLFDWHGRDAQFVYTYFAMCAAIVAAFIKQPANIKFA